MQTLNRSRSFRSKKAQAGISMISIILASILGAAALVATISVVMGQRKDTEQSQAVQFAIAEMPQLLNTAYLNNGNSWSAASLCGGGTLSAATGALTNGSGTAGSCANNLVLTKGMRPKLPNGQDWGISTVGATVVVVMPNTAKVDADLLKAAIDGAAAKISAGTKPTTAVDAAAPFAVRVTYAAPV